MHGEHAALSIAAPTAAWTHIMCTPLSQACQATVQCRGQSYKHPEQVKNVYKNMQRACQELGREPRWKSHIRV